MGDSLIVKVVDDVECLQVIQQPILFQMVC